MAQQFGNSVVSIVDKATVKHDRYGIPFVPRIDTCEVHGKYSSVELNAQGVQVSVPCCPKCSRQRAINRLIDMTAIPQKYSNTTFDDFTTPIEPMRKVKAVCEKYVENFDGVLKTGRCLTLFGKTGTGKTMLSCAMANALLQHGYLVQYARWDEIVLRVRETWSNGNSEQSERKIIKTFGKPDLLIIDEVGMSKTDGNAREIMMRIIDERYLLDKPSLLITNLTKAELLAFVGDRGLERLRDNNGILLPFLYPSMRG